MATRLEIAKGKLIRLKKEYEEATQAAYKHMAQANGQPMNDKRNGEAFFAKRDRLEEKVFQKLKEIDAQKERISLLEDREFKKANHLTANYGLQTSVKNIDEFKKRKQTKSNRDKIKMLENMLEKEEKDNCIMSEKARALIEAGVVKKWERKPIYYFVKGLRKVALMVDDHGEFVISAKYPPKDDKERDYVKKLLEVNY